MAGAALAIGALFVVFITVFLWNFVFSRDRKRLATIPGPPTIPILGNAHQLKPGGSDFYEQVIEFCEEYRKEPFFKLQLGPRTILALYKAEAVEVLLNSSKHMTKSKEYDFLHPWLGTGLLTSTGDKWKIRRRLLTPTFHFRILNDFLDVFNEQTDIMVGHLREYGGGAAFDIFPHITHCALDIICETAMGQNLNAQSDSDSEYVKAVYKISELVHKRQKAPWLWPNIIYNHLSSGHEHQNCLQVLHSFTEKVIKERSELLDDQLAGHEGDVSMDTLESEGMYLGKKKRLAFLDMLLCAARGEADLSDTDIREEVDTFMFEGHDTTAAAANWAMFLIGSHPEIQQKIHNEMDKIFGDNDRHATMEDLKEMKYLDCVIKEVLRLYPSVPMFGRELSEDCIISGIEVKKGTTGVIITAMLHSDPRYFPEPEKFIPERFLPENISGRHPYCYVPFSAGLRNCIGQRFAMNEEKVLLSSIIRRFKITATQKKEDLKPMGELILRPQNGIWVKLEER